MMGSFNIAIIRRFLIIFILQVLVLKRVNISWEEFHYIFLFIYPLFILLLPIKISRSVQLLIAFIFGLGIDMFYDSPGLHTAALLFTSFIKK